MAISVVVVARNEEKYIEKCLKCLKNQTVKAEIVVVDGHSTDKTLSIAKKYAHRVLEDNKRGVGDARNVGWMNAKGDVIAYCDADGLPPKDWVEKASRLIKGNICISGPLYPYDGGVRMKMDYKFWTNVIPRIFDALGIGMVWGSNMIIRKDILKANPFKTKILEDYDLTRRIRRQGRIKYCRELVMPVSSRSLRYGFHISSVRFYVTNLLRLKLGRGVKVGSYWNGRRDKI
jgi:glycosyltransferase involved in cell wall biosynthesis